MAGAKHKLSMYGSVAAIIAVVTLALYILLDFFTSLPLFLVFLIIIPFFLLQWRFAPSIIERAHKVEPAPRDKYRKLHERLEDICERSEIEKPQLMIAKTELPNAFAYGNRWSGKKVAVTQGLLDKLEFEEVEAVLGHEIGHHKHGDARIMMFLSILPAIFLMIGRMFLLSIFFGGGGRRGGAPMMMLAAGSMAIYFVLNLCIMNFSRMREFMADSHAAETVSDGARKLSEGLAKINHHMARMKERGSGRATAGGPSASGRKLRVVRSGSGRRIYIRRSGNRKNRTGTGNLGMSLKPLFIEDPDTSKDLSLDQLSDQELVQRYKEKELSLGERIMELFSSHPNIASRLEALESVR